MFAGNDGIHDAWLPYGTADLLKRAAIIGWKGDFRRDDQVETALDLISVAGTRALGIRLRHCAGRPHHAVHRRVQQHCRTVAAHSSGKLALDDGKIVARDGVTLSATMSVD